MIYTTVEIRKAVKETCDSFFIGKMADDMYFALCGEIEKNLEQLEGDLWIATYWDEESEPTVTAFNNKESAEKYYQFIKTQHKKACLDKVPVYNKFESYN